MAGVQGLMTLLLTVTMLWASLFVSGTNGQTAPCSIICPAEYDPVCGSDGTTYDNDCYLSREQICRDSRLMKAHDGKCTQTTTPFQTTTPCDIPCSFIYQPVCGSNGVTYSNECLLENRRRCRDPRLYKVRDGECTQTTTPCDIPCPSIYQPVCGSNGLTYGTECQLQNEKRCRYPYLYTIRDGPCLQTTTTCDRACAEIYRPVCGSDWKTYSNQCELDNERRCRNPNLKKKHDGGCRVGSDCDKPCPEHHQPVCGSDLNTYNSFCLFEVAQCKFNIEIKKINAPCSSAMKPTASTLMAMMALLGNIFLVLL